MTRISRRDAIVGVAGLAGAALTTQLLVPSAHAAAPMLGAKRPEIYRFKLGDFEVTTILDGTVVRKGIHPTFGQDQGKDIVGTLAEANNLSAAALENPYTPVLVNTGKQLVLFDTGNGERRRKSGSGNLLRLLQEAGYRPEQIDLVVVTHGHPDHVGGLLEAGKPAFPNAGYIFGEVEFDYWRKGENIPERRKSTREFFMQQAVPFAEKARFLKAGGEVVTGIRSIETFGHSPGHLAFHIESAGRQLLLWADACNHYVLSLQRPDWHVGFDQDKDRAVAARKKILDMAATDRIPATGYHMPFPAVGFVEKSGTGYRWAPATYQLHL